MGTKVSGTREWSAHSVNCLLGCSHDCRYCYARANALRFRRIKTPDEWATPVLRQKEITRPRPKKTGRVMFPTTHDILPQFLAECTVVLTNLLAAGNEVLIVSKPHLDCIQSLCDVLEGYRNQITFRFTIGALWDNVLYFWEPGAPSFSERFDSLRYSLNAGFKTSVSCEPLLEGGSSAVRLFNTLAPYVTDTLWFGKMNQPRLRCTADTSLDEIARIERLQTPGAIRWLYEQLKDEPKVRWKESYKAVLGLPTAKKAGMDV